METKTYAVGNMATLPGRIRQQHYLVSDKNDRGFGLKNILYSTTVTVKDAIISGCLGYKKQHVMKNSCHCVITFGKG